MAKMVRHRLSTTDNPFNPWTQYDLWASFDEKVCKYNTVSYQARIAVGSPDTSGPDLEESDEDAIAQICAFDLPIFSPVTKKQEHYIAVPEPEPDRISEEK